VLLPFFILVVQIQRRQFSVGRNKVASIRRINAKAVKLTKVLPPKQTTDATAVPAT
jgi:hypothetical protein